MARLSVTSIFKQIAATVNQEATAPTDGGTEYLLWLEYLNRAYFEWAEANDWEVLRKRFIPTISGISGATVGLPLDFKRLAAPVKLYANGQINPTEFPEVLEEQEGLYSSNDKYVTLTGDPSNGYAVIFHPGTLASGASVVIQYFATPTSLASPAEIPLIEDSQFLIDRTIGYILEARSDPRFQLMENKARDRLLTMIENNNLSKFNSYGGFTPVISTAQRTGFRVGRD